MDIPADALDPDIASDAVASGWSSAARYVGTRSVLEVYTELERLLDGSGLRRGALYTVTGSRSLMLALIARASRRAWCAIVGLRGLGLAAARDAGVCLEHLVLIGSPGRRWAEVVATLVDGFEVVVLRQSGVMAPALVRRLRARARQRGTVLIVVCEEDAPSIDDVHLDLRVLRGHWEGIGDGHGHLLARRVEVRAQGKGAAARPRVASLWLPSTFRPVADVDEPVGVLRMVPDATPPAADGAHR